MMNYLMAAIVMTLSVLEGHSPIGSPFKCDFFLYLRHVSRSVCICTGFC